MGIGGCELLDPSSWDSGASSTGGVRVVWVPQGNRGGFTWRFMDSYK